MKLDWSKIKATIIKSIVWKSVVELFKSEKNIDISSFVISVKISWDTILIKTNKPLINSELTLLNNSLFTILNEKFDKMGIKFDKLEIKYT